MVYPWYDFCLIGVSTSLLTSLLIENYQKLSIFSPFLLKSDLKYLIHVSSSVFNNLNRKKLNHKLLIIKKITDIALDFKQLSRKTDNSACQSNLLTLNFPFQTYLTPDNNTPKNSSPQNKRVTYFHNLVFN